MRNSAQKITFYRVAENHFPQLLKACMRLSQTMQAIQRNTQPLKIAKSKWQFLLDAQKCTRNIRKTVTCGIAKRGTNVSPSPNSKAGVMITPAIFSP